MKRCMQHRVQHGVFLLATAVLAATMGLSAAKALAQESDAPAHALQRCARIASAGERLACYDALAGRPTSAITTAPAAAAAPAPPPEKTFGLSTVQQRGPVDELESIAAKVTQFGQSRDGRQTIALDNGQVWELDASDPLLKGGDAITIRRAALGSFILSTAQKRSHRVRRLH